MSDPPAATFICMRNFNVDMLCVFAIYHVWYETPWHTPHSCSTWNACNVNVYSLGYKGISFPLETLQCSLILSITFWTARIGFYPFIWQRISRETAVEWLASELFGQNVTWKVWFASDCKPSRTQCSFLQFPVKVLSWIEIGLLQWRWWLAVANTENAACEKRAMIVPDQIGHICYHKSLTVWLTDGKIHWPSIFYGSQNADILCITLQWIKRSCNLPEIWGTVCFDV